MAMNDEPVSPGLDILTLADLQDQLLIVVSDLSRLQVLLDEACTSLLDGFHGTRNEIHSLAAGDGPAGERALATIEGAVTSLQFQDLANQLLDHARSRLAHVGDRLAAEAFGSDEDGAAVIHQMPTRPNPVTQSDMVAGSVELF